MTFWEVIRAAELHRYPFVVIENVVEAAEWELFDVWLAGMTALGYQHQFISISAAHAFDVQGNHPAPQWWDRIYGIFTRTGIKQPDLSPRPLAYCPRCDHVVEAVQWWKPRKGQKTFLGRQIGKYGPQYLYVCPVGDHGVIEPYAAPAAAAIDLTPTSACGPATGSSSVCGRSAPRLCAGSSTACAPSVTREAHALMQAGIAVEDCYYRMLNPRESANAQRFPPDYTIHGNNGERQTQAGNAVPVNVARWIGNGIKTVL